MKASVLIRHFVPALALCCVEAHALNLLTEENPPFNYTENKQVVGQSTAVIAEMAKRAGIATTTQVMAWAPAYTKAQGDKDTCLYSTARLTNRENLFKWIGPIAVNQWGLYAKSAFTGKIASLKDTRPYRIGGVANDAKVEFLRQQGVTNIVATEKDAENPAKLTLDRKETGKIDLWITSAGHAQSMARQAGVKDLKLVLVVREEPLYLACSPTTSADTVKKLAAAVAEMEKDGSLKRISAQHAPK